MPFLRNSDLFSINGYKYIAPDGAKIAKNLCRNYQKTCVETNGASYGNKFNETNKARVSDRNSAAIFDSSNLSLNCSP